MTSLLDLDPKERTIAAIRVLIVDDHPLVRGGLVALLDGEVDIEVVGAVGSGEDAVTAEELARADVVLMDLQLPGMDGIEATRRLRASGSTAAVVVLTSFADSERILRAFEAGAVGYLLKDATPNEVLAGVRSAADGHSPIAPQAARALVADRWAARSTAQASAGNPLESDRRIDRLTERELEVLHLVRNGHANKQIARRLEISEATVKAHLTSIFQRIGVRDRTQAAVWAHERGL